MGILTISNKVTYREDQLSTLFSYSATLSDYTANNGERTLMFGTAFMGLRVYSSARRIYTAEFLLVPQAGI